MIFGGLKCYSLIETIGLIILVLNLVNVDCGGTEVVEIVTPQTAKTSTTEKPVTPKPEKPKKNALVDWTLNDSYLQAYRDLHRAKPVKRNDLEAMNEQPPKTPQDQGYNTLIRSTYLPDDKYPSLTHQQWMSSYSSPSPAYGPFPQCHDHAPTHSWHDVPYSSPSHSFFPLLPKKLSLKLLLKIILKLVLFKMIVKFIAVICLLLFLPLLKSKETEKDDDGEERRRMRQLDVVSNFIWDSISEKTAAYDEEEELKDIKEIADVADNEPSSYSGPLSAVKFLQFCVSTVDRVVGYMLSYLKKKRNEEEDDLSIFIWDKFHNFVDSL